MNRCSVGFLRVVFAIVIVFLAGTLSISISAIFHTQSKVVAGITFFAAAVCLVLLFEKVFPSVYSGSMRRPTPWWQWRGSVAMALAIVVSILSSRIATLWFGGLIISGVMVALLLRASRRDGEL